MTPKSYKRMAEVVFPIVAVLMHLTIERSIRHGFPSNLHLLWPRGTLAACPELFLFFFSPISRDQARPKGNTVIDARSVFKTPANKILKLIDFLKEGKGLFEKLLSFIAFAVFTESIERTRFCLLTTGIIGKKPSRKHKSKPVPPLSAGSFKQTNDIGVLPQYGREMNLKKHGKSFRT